MCRKWEVIFPFYQELTRPSVVCRHFVALRPGPGCRAIKGPQQREYLIFNSAKCLTHVIPCGKSTKHPILQSQGNLLNLTQLVRDKERTCELPSVCLFFPLHHPDGGMTGKWCSEVSEYRAEQAE